MIHLLENRSWKSIFEWIEEAALGKYQFTLFNELGDKRK